MKETIAIRPATPEDSYSAFLIHTDALADLRLRMGSNPATSYTDPQAMERMWKKRRPLFEHLAQTGDQFWIAEEAGKPVGYARSILRERWRQLTELFVLPDRQSGGIGSALLSHALPGKTNETLSIIATPDSRAQGLYLKQGVYPSIPLYYFYRAPEEFEVETDLEMLAASNQPETARMLGGIDQAVLGYRRDADHAFLLASREAFFFHRAGELMGYGYLSEDTNGPIAVLDPEDIPAALSYMESEAASQDHSHFGIEVPMVNQRAVDHLLNRKYQLDTFMAVFMSNRPFRKLDRYIFTFPPFFL